MKLIIMAAGMGSRYGGLKQIDGFGPNRETLMDYAIYDAVRNGYDEVILIIREEMQGLFDQTFPHQFNHRIKLSYAYQSLPEGGKRKKPWGTAHAVLSAREAVEDSAFTVINADDYYGATAFNQLSQFESELGNSAYAAMIGYPLGKTLSRSGSVARGWCVVDEDGWLVKIVEKTKIIEENGEIVNKEDIREPLLYDDVVSMNCWAFAPGFLEYFQNGFDQFITSNGASDSKELYIADVLNDLLEKKAIRVIVLRSHDDWFGVTYANEKAMVQENIRKLIEKGLYPHRLWS